LPGPTTLLATVSSTATGYLDQGLTDGTSYSYYLQSVDSSGVTTGLHISANSVTVSAIPSPGNFNAPSNLVATGGVGQVNLSWSDSVTFLGSAPVTGYTLYRSLSLSSGYVVIANLARGVTTSTYLNSGLANGTTYYYYLTPYASGLAGPSNSATVFAAASRPPNPPAPPSEVDGNNQVVLNWSSAGVTIDGVPVTQYIVNRTPGSPITVYNATTALDATVSNGTSYTYQIQSVNIYGIVSALSAPPVAGNPYVTGLPAPLTSSSSTTAVTLTWNAPTAPASSFPVSTYTILRSITSGNEAPLTVVTATGSPMNFTDSTVTAGQLYYYEVQATDTKGHLSPLSSEIYDGATSQLAAPATFITTAGSQQVLLDWPAPAPALGTLPVSLYILIGPSGGPVTLPASQTWYLDTYASDPTTVVYSLQAVDDTGRVSGSHASTVVGPLTVTTSAFILNPPTALAAKATGPTAIQLTWTKPRDMGQIVASYLIYRSSSFSALGSLVATVPNPALAPATIYVDTGLNPNSVYYYVVQAVYAPSSTASPNSNHAWAATPPPNKAIPPVTVSQMAFDANLVLPLQGQQLGIYYVVPNSGAVEIRIYNVAGDLIRVLNPGSATANQQQSTTWDMKDKTGQWASSGVYFVEIRASGFHQVKKVAVVK
jgi:fibronectin type 3 domain-containing protein